MSIFPMNSWGLAMDGKFPFEFIGSGAMDHHFPYEFIGFGVGWPVGHWIYRVSGHGLPVSL